MYFMTKSQNVLTFNQIQAVLGFVAPDFNDSTGAGLVSAALPGKMGTFALPTAGDTTLGDPTALEQMGVFARAGLIGQTLTDEQLMVQRVISGICAMINSYTLHSMVYLAEDMPQIVVESVIIPAALGVLRETKLFTGTTPRVRGVSESGSRIDFVNEDTDTLFYSVDIEDYAMFLTGLRRPRCL